jgi:hypothetical protein
MKVRGNFISPREGIGPGAAANAGMLQSPEAALVTGNTLR